MVSPFYGSACACFKQPSGNSVSYFPAATQTPEIWATFQRLSAPFRGRMCLPCEACGSVETRHVVRGATTRGGQSTGRKLEGVWGVDWECNTRRPFSLGMGAGRGTAFSALPSPSVAVCGSVGQRSLLAKMSLVNALESGTGEAPCQGVSGVPVQGGEDGLLGKNPIFGRRTPFLPGLSSLASPPALRKQCLVPIYSASVNY